MLRRIPLIVFAKLLRRALRAMGKHGSALPGRIIEKLDKHFLSSLLAQLPHGTVVVTGTNGKTTTTHMLVHLLRAEGKRVLTNSSGSNLTRGLISTITEHARWNGTLSFDIAIFELDEAYAPLFAAEVHPSVLLALNVMRDQLDRYGELDTTASLIARAAVNAQSLIVNGNDNLLMEKTASHSHRLTFGLTGSLQSSISSEANLYNAETKTNHATKLDAEVIDIKTTGKGTGFTFNCSNLKTQVELPLLGAHNVVNATAALFTTKSLFPEVSLVELAKHLDRFVPAFGRGETMVVDGRELTVALIKNPSGFTQNLATFIQPHIDAVLIVINDEYADGRDVSWLWDVQFAKLEDFKGQIMIAGKRRFDMALRLKYQDIPFTVVDEDRLGEVMKQVLKSDLWHKHLLIIPTYTAMLSVRRWLNIKRGGRRTW